MIRKTLPEPGLTVPQILTQQCRPLITIIMQSLSLALTLINIGLHQAHVRMKMEGIEEPLDRRGSFIEERVVRVSRFHGCPDLDLGDEDAEVLEDFGAGGTCCVGGVLF